MRASLILENGAIFTGQSIGLQADCTCQFVFHTGMTGYQQTLSDPSSRGLGLVMSYPLIGNCGVITEDETSLKPQCAALVVRHLSPRGSNFRCEGSLGDYLTQYAVTGIEGVDTRAITRILRSQGAMLGTITCAESFSAQALISAMKAPQVACPSEVTCKAAYTCPAEGEEKFRVAVMDYGLRPSTLAPLMARGCAVSVFPAGTKAAEVLAQSWDGLVLSGGPGDANTLEELIREVKTLYNANLPTFGFGLGHQLLAAALGARAVPLPYGHRGASQPVQNFDNARVLITAQNHGFTLDEATLNPALMRVRYRNLNDASVEGIDYVRGNTFTVEFEPDTPLGPMDCDNLYNEFLCKMKGDVRNA